jgi:hypothetical protein
MRILKKEEETGLTTSNIIIKIIWFAVVTLIGPIQEPTQTFWLITWNTRFTYE